MLSAEELKTYITNGFNALSQPCEYVEVRGDDGQHFEAIVVSAAFVGKNMVQQHQLGCIPEPMLAVIADVYRVNATDSYLRSGQRLRTAGHASAAMDAYARAVRLSPGRWDAHFGFGCAADAAGDAQAAAEHYFRALECDPQAVSALNNLGVLFVRQGKPEAALAAWEEVVRIVPYDQVGRVNLGHALAALGRTDDAALQYRTALAIDPQSAEAKAGLSRLGLAE